MSAFNFIFFGRVDDIRVATGIAWHICEAAEDTGLLGRKFGIDFRKVMGARGRYLFKQLLKFEKPTGFQWSWDMAASCTKQLLAEDPFDLPVMSCFPNVLDIASIPEEAKVFWYIDATPKQLGRHYGLAERVSARTMHRINLRFRSNVEGAACTIGRSEWVRKSLLEEYGIAAEKTAVVLPGCNISCKLLDKSDEIIQTERAKLDKNYDFVVNFCGLDWRRKGLDVLLDAWKQFVANNKGRFLLRVIGPCPEEIREGGWPNVEFTGRFDKSTQAEWYIRCLAGANLFCLPTKADATPQVLVESLRMGTPVVCPNIGGIPELVKDKINGLCIDPPMDVDVCLNILTDLYRNREKLLLIREGADRTRLEYDWRPVVSKLAGLMD